jgi:hypothetical protein
MVMLGKMKYIPIKEDVKDVIMFVVGNKRNGVKSNP